LSLGCFSKTLVTESECCSKKNANIQYSEHFEQPGITEMKTEGTDSSNKFIPPAPDPNWELVGKADRYVYEEGRTARIRPADISKVLSPDKVAEVQRMVDQFNKLTDEQFRYERTYDFGNEPASTSTPLATTSTTLATCKDQASAKWRWFGLQITVNECLGRKIIEGVNHPSVNAFLTAIAAIKPLGGLIATAIKIHLALYKKWMDWASDYCGNKGFEINATWLGVITISRVCKKFG
jgi:hypothetical protein